MRSIELRGNALSGNAARGNGARPRTLDIAPHREYLTSEALGCGARCQGISQFYLHIHAFICEQNERCFCLPSQSWSSLTDLEGMKG